MVGVFQPLVSNNTFVGLITAGASKDKDTQEAVVGYLRTISVSSSKLLLAAKALSADPNAPNVMNQLAAAARCVITIWSFIERLCSELEGAGVVGT